MTQGTIVRRKEAEHPFSCDWELEEVGLVIVGSEEVIVRMDGMKLNTVQVLWSKREILLEEYEQALEAIDEKG